MNDTEALIIIRMVRAGCPHQTFDEYTIDVWTRSLSDLKFTDAETAITNLIGRTPFVGPSEIRTEVRRIRTDRLERTVMPDPPPHIDADNARAFMEWQRATTEAIADGAYVEPPQQLKPRDMRVINGAFQAVPR